MKLIFTRLTLLALTVLTFAHSAAAQTRRGYLPPDVRDSVERTRRLPPAEVEDEDIEQEDIDLPRLPRRSPRPEPMPRQQAQAQRPVFEIYDAYRNFCGHFVADQQGILYRVVGGQMIPQPEGRLVSQQDARTFLAVNLAGQPYIALRIR